MDSLNEKSILQGICLHCDVSGLSSRDHGTAGGLDLVLHGEYEQFLQGETTQQILKADNKTLTVSQLESFVQANVLQYLSDNGDIQSKYLSVLGTVVSCLQLFVQNNWTGPRTMAVPTTFLPNCFQSEEKAKELREYMLSELSCDGEPVYELIVHPEYLYIPRLILTTCRQQLHHLQTVDWWLMRCLKLQQEFLDNKSPTLKSEIMELIDNLSNREPLLTEDQNRNIRIQFHLEAGHLCHVFYEYRRAHKHFETAKKISGLAIDFTGVLGKRTRFQQDAKTQLVMDVKRTDGTGEGNHTDAIRRDTKADDSVYPKNLLLNDDTVLDHLQYEDQSEASTISLSPVESVLLIGLMENHRRSSASQDTKNEELMAFITHTLSQPMVWTVQLTALCLRSKLEKSSGRRAERSFTQMEELINCTSREEPSVVHRIPYFHATVAPTLTNLQKELAETLMSIGGYSAACDILEKLHLWEDLIICYRKMGKTEKAESLIREQLAVKETPNLYCFLGDVTRNIEDYQKAWELSNKRSARAQRGMAYLYMGRQQYEESLVCFENSLKINSLQIPVWFTYGCAAMACQQYEKAAQAFHRCVSLDYDNFEAWSNLSTAYVRLGQKPRAFTILQDAIKCCYDNWRLWENSLVIGTDCGEFKEVIKAYHRLLDLKDKYIDAEVLVILTNAITENLPDAKGQPCGSLRLKALELFGRITAKGHTNADIWKAYADLSLTGEEGSQDKALRFLQKAHSCLMQENNWEKDLKKCLKIGMISLQLSQAYVTCSCTVSPNQAVPLISSAKLMLKGVVMRIKKEHEFLPEDLKAVHQSLESELEKVTQKQSELKAS